MVGKTISHYKILEKLGSGGMGVVYKAQDTKLDRLVALKFLPPHLSQAEEEKKRFVHEAKAASALDHPNICTIHEIDETDDGQMFIAMAYYDGESLKDKIERGPFTIEEALHIAIQISNGLTKAHSQNIVHRDIKPANILITEDGQVKIVDFGLAKLAGRTMLTKEGTTLGTVAYMSPEQTQGAGADHRTDIWALGVVLFEMLTGRQPFHGDYEQAVMYSIINEDAEPLTGLRTGVPMELERIVNKSLAKEPEERYQHCDDLAADIKKLRRQIAAPEKAEPVKATREKRTDIQKRKILLPAGVILVVALIVFLVKNFFLTQEDTGIDSIAVLPLENLSSDLEQEYFVDGMHDALIGELARIRALKVISRTSVMQYKKVYKPLPEIGEELDVKGIVEGTVIYAGDRLRINVQLIEAATDRHLWANDFESEMKDVLLLQKEIAQAIANEIKIILTPEERTLLSTAHLVDPQAHDKYLQAVDLLRKGAIADRKYARDFLEEAVEIDPNFARAYLVLANYYNQIHFYAGLPAKEVFPKAKAAARKALKLDETLGEAHAELGWALAVFDWNWQAAEKEYKRALELKPGSYEIHASYGWALSWMGRHGEAIYELKRAVELNPLSIPAMSNLSVVHSMARRYDEAIEIATRAVAMSPGHAFAYLRLGDAYAGKGWYTKAIDAYGKGGSLSGGSSLFKAGLGYSYGMAGQTKQAAKILEGLLQNHAPNNIIAGVYVGLNKTSQALDYLEKAYDDREGNLALLKVQYRWDPLRDHPRFQELIRRMNFPK